MQTFNFTYDNINRLTGLTDGTNTESYSYDPVGNRTMSGYTTGSFNRLTATSSNTYEYNANGSIRRRSSAIDFSWDRENRLVSASTGDTRQFAYDALGRRVSSLFNPLQATLEPPVPERYTYDGQDVILDDNTDSDRPNVNYQNAPGIDNKLSMSSNGDRPSYFLQDHLGSTVALAESNGISETNSYDSFGNPTNSSFSSRYQFTGREFDSFSGLQYSRARFYDPQIGRFISEDPIGFAGGDVNLYGYVKNRPLKFTDPLGQFGWCLGVDGRPVPCSPFPFMFDPTWPFEGVMDRGWRAEEANFPNGDPTGSTDVYGGAYRHCVATCYLNRRYGPLGGLGRRYWDWSSEDPNNANSRDDMRGEDIGELICGREGKTCEEGCLEQYPNR